VEALECLLVLPLQAHQAQQAQQQVVPLAVAVNQSIKVL
jgi:hypothetical protein